MGLDMYFYLKEKRPVEGWTHGNDDEYKSFGRYDAERGAVDMTTYPEDIKELAEYIYKINFKSTFINRDGFRMYQIGYFRKFNALHNYIVNNLANGVDECQEIEITKDNLYDLLDTLTRVDNDKDLADSELPTADGFFFGSTCYDDWYFSDVKDAIEMCELFLAKIDFDKYDLIYRASW